METGSQEKPFLNVIVHSFFVIPFLIAVFCVLLFTAVHLLTKEEETPSDILNDVKVGGLTKRWQAAYQLSKILSNTAIISKDPQFNAELISAFRQSKSDDPRVRQYLALAMGRTGRSEFFEPLAEGIQNEKEENLYAMIYALGMLREQKAGKILRPFLTHSNARIRSAAIAALGNIGDEGSVTTFKIALNDPEPNVQWTAALSLAKLGDDSGKGVLIHLLDRQYLSKFKEVDPQEANNLVLLALQAASILKSKGKIGHDLNALIKYLSENDPNMKVRALALEFFDK